MKGFEKYEYSRNRYSHIHAYICMMKCPIGKLPYCRCAEMDENGNERLFDFMLDSYSYYHGLKYHRPLDSFKSDSLMVLVVGYLSSDNSREIIILTELHNFIVVTEKGEFLENNRYKDYNLRIKINDNSIVIDMPIWQYSDNFISTNILTNIEGNALSLYVEKIDNGIFEYVPEEKQLRRIDEIVKYVESFDKDAVFNSYKVIYSGRFQRRVGRDDHYFYSYERTIDTNDIYICSLFNLICVNDYYSCVGQGDEERDVSEEVQYDSMKEEINMATKRYTKERHIAFLVMHYYKEVMQKSNLNSQIDAQIKSIYSR